ncbi:hypothetical protein [Rhizobium nepotum]|uniref:hypothetical protein n=1 Tax=Rhizobium nepotum TaxID=1035271 RepID=UPI003CFA5D7C
MTRFPILLIDEEDQDTNRRLMDALLDVEEGYRDAFCLGLFGDMMQRIYADGKDRLAEAIPDVWAKPTRKPDEPSLPRARHHAHRIQIRRG